MLRAVVLGLAAVTDPGLADWIAAHAAFPRTMVDRIVPATRPADLDDVAALIGLRDEAAVVCEPFRQLVIEDAFRGPRPPWERAGAEIVADVASYEAMRMRLLNGCQSALGWLGDCARTAYALAEPRLSSFAAALIARETAPTVTMVPDLGAYRASVLRRLANTALRHTTWQIANDGSQKIPQRLVAPFRERLARGEASPRLALAIAAWIQFVAVAPDLPDALAPVLTRAASGAGTAGKLVAALLGATAVFGDLVAHPGAHGPITHALTLLRDVGPIEAAARGEAT